MQGGECDDQIADTHWGLIVSDLELCTLGSRWLRREEYSMIEVSECVICDGPIRQIKRAVVAPFLAKRIWSRAPFCVDLVKCESCEFMFYNPRLDDADLQREYEGYRSDGYLHMRHSFEPWYTAKFNADLGSKTSYETRRALLAPIIRKHVGQRKVNRILDYGGDHGDLVLGLFEDAELFLYDISGAAALPGVTPIGDPARCKPDLIVNSNVLEHVGFPRVLVSQILQAAPEGGLVFVEVPCEFALGATRIVRRIAQIGIMVLRQPRLAPYLFRPAALYMMHEHINYYTEHCLTTLMRSCGSKVVASGTYPYSGRAGKADVAWCLAEKRS